MNKQYLSPMDRHRLSVELEKVVARDPRDGFYKYRAGMTDAIFAMRHKDLLANVPGDKVKAVTRLRYALFGPSMPMPTKSGEAPQPQTAPGDGLTMVKLRDMEERVRLAAGYVREMIDLNEKHSNRLRGIEVYLKGAIEPPGAEAAEPAAPAPAPDLEPEAAWEDADWDADWSEQPEWPEELSPPPSKRLPTPVPEMANAEQLIVNAFRGLPSFGISEAEELLVRHGRARTSAQPTLSKGRAKGVFIQHGAHVWRVAPEKSRPKAEPPKRPPVPPAPDHRPPMTAEQMIVDTFKGHDYFHITDAERLLEARGWSKRSASPILYQGWQERGTFIRFEERGFWAINPKPDPSKPPPWRKGATKELEKVEAEERQRMRDNRSVGQIMGKGRPAPGEPDAYSFLVERFKDAPSFSIPEARKALEDRGWSANTAAPTLAKGAHQKGLFEYLGEGHWRVARTPPSTTPMTFLAELFGDGRPFTYEQARAAIVEAGWEPTAAKGMAVSAKFERLDDVHWGVIKVESAAEERVKPVPAAQTPPPAAEPPEPPPGRSRDTDIAFVQLLPDNES